LALEAHSTGRKDEAKRRRRILLETGMCLAVAGERNDAPQVRWTNLPRQSSAPYDYRKYSDSLRMVIDCTQAQADDIVALLETEHRRGGIDFGTHRAGAALMTCFVRNTQEAGHVHFIDGAEGVMRWPPST